MRMSHVIVLLNTSSASVVVCVCVCMYVCVRARVYVFVCVRACAQSRVYCPLNTCSLSIHLHFYPHYHTCVWVIQVCSLHYTSPASICISLRTISARITYAYDSHECVIFTLSTHTYFPPATISDPPPPVRLQP